MQLNVWLGHGDIRVLCWFLHIHSSKVSELIPVEMISCFPPMLLHETQHNLYHISDMTDILHARACFIVDIYRTEIVSTVYTVKEDVLTANRHFCSHYVQVKPRWKLAVRKLTEHSVTQGSEPLDRLDVEEIEELDVEEIEELPPENDVCLKGGGWRRSGQIQDGLKQSWSLNVNVCVSDVTFASSTNEWLISFTLQRSLI